MRASLIWVEPTGDTRGLKSSLSSKAGSTPSILTVEKVARILGLLMARMENTFARTPMALGTTICCLWMSADDSPSVLARGASHFVGRVERRETRHLAEPSPTPSPSIPLIPAKAGTQNLPVRWPLAFAGVTRGGVGRRCSCAEGRSRPTNLVILLRSRASTQQNSRPSPALSPENKRLPK